VQRATWSNLVEVHRGRALVMTTPEGEKRRFEGIVELAQWATAKAIGTAENEWLRNGQDLSWHVRNVPGDGSFWTLG
jgi:hypothetical protein